MTGSHLVLILGGRYERNCDIDAAFALKCLIRIGNKTGQRESMLRWSMFYVHIDCMSKCD